MKQYLPFFYPGLTQKSLAGISAFVRLLIALALCLPLQTSLSYAQFSGSGSGTEGEPFQISTATHLNEIRNNLSAHYILLNDIDLTFDTSDPAGLFWNGGLGWEPIGTVDDLFTGGIDGNGFSIIGIRINRPEGNFVAFLGYVASPAEISNLGIEAAEITGFFYTGSLLAYGNGATVSNCFATGSVTGIDFTGGLSGGVTSNLTECYANVNVVATGGNTGGFSGIVSGATIENCYVTGNVSGTSSVGGFAGYVFTSGSEGGGSITNCFSSGLVTGNSNAGGFAGLAEGDEVTSVYWSTSSSGQATSAVGSGLDMGGMRTEDSFSGWDFTNIWTINEYSSFPFLINNQQSPAPGHIVTMTTGTLTACGMDFTDSGGFGASHASSEDYTLTFEPENENEKVKVSFSAFNLETDYDELEVFDGPSTSSPLIVTLSGSAIPADITASSSGGQLTFRFTSDGSFEFAGWAAVVTCAVVPPDKPSPVTFASVTGTSVVVNWVAPDDNGVEITSYTLAQKEGAAASYSDVYTGTDLTYAATGLTQGETYNYKVKATSDAGDSEFSDAAEVALENIVTMSNGSISTCDAVFLDPGGASNYTSSLDIVLTVEPELPNTRTSISFSSFQLENNYDYLYIYDGSTTASPLLATLTGGSIPADYTASGVDGTLTFRFTSDGSAEYAGWEAQITCLAATAPSQAAGVTFENTSSSSTTAKWTAPANGGSPITGYTLQMKEGVDGEYVTVYTGENLTYTATGLQAGESYYFKVVATNAIGDSPASVETSVTPPATVPGSPLSVEATPASSSAVDVSWEAPEETGGFPILGYRVIRRVKGTSTFEFEDVGLVTNHTISGLSAGVTYEVQVMAKNQLGLSTYGILVEVATLKLAQTITFDDVPAQTFLGEKVSMLTYVRSSSGLYVTTQIVSGPATIDAGIVSFTGAGEVVVKATQAGSSTYAAAEPVQKTIIVQKASQSIQASNLSATFGDDPLEVSASATSGLAVSLSLASGPGALEGNTLTIAGAGSIIIHAKQAGSDNYLPADQVTITTTVAKGAQLLSAVGASGAGFNGTLIYSPGGFTLEATSNTSNAIVFSVVAGSGQIDGQTFIPLAAGSFTIAASQEETDNWTAASKTFELFVQKAQQEIIADQVADKLKSETPFTLSASSSADAEITALSGTGKTSFEGLTATIDPSAAAGVEVISLTGAETTFYESKTIDVVFCIIADTPTILAAENSSGDFLLSSNNLVDSHQWHLNGESVGLTGPGEAFAIEQSGNYHALALATNGCPSSGASNTVEIVPEEVTGVGTDHLANLLLFPNPAQQIVSLSMDNALGETVVVTMRSIAGSVHERQVFEKPSGKWQASLDISRLPSGIFFIVIQQGDALITKKMIKQ
ncbi:MAG: fibronectin type III domain-containing protein [Imperialibacter sp.]|uniref:fibronectin type III domain-containing protein n=1 Tax=Imperialibacter sp. TaxID=2038411 RepID=UPI0030DAD376|tara:strand:+ start:87826 stop:91965 length:4140 start_codon:yes stop_codon:yes gene_type:complete